MASGNESATAPSAARPGPYSQRVKSKREVIDQLFEDSQIVEVAEAGYETKAPMAAGGVHVQPAMKKEDEANAPMMLKKENELSASMKDMTQMMAAQQRMIEMVARAASQAAEAAAMAAASIAQEQQTTTSGLHHQKPTLGADDAVLMAQAVAAQVTTTMTTMAAAAPIKIEINENRKDDKSNNDDGIMGEDKKD